MAPLVHTRAPAAPTSVAAAMELIPCEVGWRRVKGHMRFHCARKERDALAAMYGMLKDQWNAITAHADYCRFQRRLSRDLEGTTQNRVNIQARLLPKVHFNVARVIIGLGGWKIGEVFPSIDLQSCACVIVLRGAADVHTLEIPKLAEAGSVLLVDPRCTTVISRTGDTCVGYCVVNPKLDRFVKEAAVPQECWKALDTLWTAAKIRAAAGDTAGDTAETTVGDTADVAASATAGVTASAASSAPATASASTSAAPGACEADLPPPKRRRCGVKEAGAPFDLPQTTFRVSPVWRIFAVLVGTVLLFYSAGAAHIRRTCTSSIIIILFRRSGAYSS